MDQKIVEAYQAAVINEMALYAESETGKAKVDSIYFGGGTPSLLPAEYIAAILNACRKFFDVSMDSEISMEANPDTLLSPESRSFIKAGVNRISIGAQSFHGRELKIIGRVHTPGAITESVKKLQENGLTNINLDLLLGLPLQTADTWRENLKQVANLDISHVSVYMLDLDEPCPLSESVADGSVMVPDDDCIADLYLETIEILASYGYPQYEISNFSKPDRACRHNLKYWLRSPVIGFGLASHSFDGRSRYANFSEMGEYLDTVESGRLPVQWRRPLGEKQALEETLFLGLRLNQGLQWSRLKDSYGGECLVKYERDLQQLSFEGLTEWKGSVVRLTPSGMLLSNEIFQRFV